MPPLLPDSRRIQPDEVICFSLLILTGLPQKNRLVEWNRSTVKMSPFDGVAQLFPPKSLVEGKSLVLYWPAALIGWTTPAVSNGTTLPLPSVIAAFWTLTSLCRRKTALSLLDLGTLPVRVPY